jgi:hypothetical protein
MSTQALGAANPRVSSPNRIRPGEKLHPPGSAARAPLEGQPPPRAPPEYARFLAETLGQVPGANFIVPHGNASRWGPDPGAVSADGRTTEIGLGRFLVEEGFFKL